MKKTMLMAFAVLLAGSAAAESKTVKCGYLMGGYHTLCSSASGVCNPYQVDLTYRTNPYSTATFTVTNAPAGWKITDWLLGKGTWHVNNFKNQGTSSSAFTYTWQNQGDPTNNVAVRFDPVNVTLTFNANGGSNVPDTIGPFHSTNKVTVAKYEGTRTGYGFNGWFDEQGKKAFSGKITFNSFGAGNKTTNLLARSFLSNNNGMAISMPGKAYFNIGNTDTNITLTASWTGNWYKVTFDANGGSVSPGWRNVQFGKKYESFPTPAYEGKTFKGWYTAASGGTLVTGDTLVSTAADHTIYAQWLDKPVVTFYYMNANNATVYETQFVDYGGTAVPPARETVDQCPGRTFTGWDRTYNNVIGSIEVHAEYSVNSYNVVYLPNCDESSGTMDPDHYACYVPWNLPANQFRRPGYSFAGWNTKADGTGASYSDSQQVSNLSYDNGGTVTLYAQWSPISYTIAFSGGAGAEGGMDAKPTVYGQAVTLPANTFTKTGCEFLHWAFGTTNFLDGATVSNLTTTVGATVTLTAVWDAPYYIAFDANGGEGTMDVQRFERGEEKALSSNEFTRTGYAFSGWATNAAEAASMRVKYSDGETVVNIADVAETNTLYAVWSTNAYYVAFDANGGEGDPMAPQRFFYDQAQNLTSNTYSKGELWRFDGWSNTVAGVVYADGASVSNLCTEADATNKLVAVWADNRTDLSKAMHCENMQWTNVVIQGWSGGRWTPRKDGDLGYNPSGSCVEQEGGTPGDALRSSVVTNGVLSFWCRNVASVEAILLMTTNALPDKFAANDAELNNSILTTLPANSDWRKLTVNITHPGEGDYYIKFAAYTGTVQIDQMKWLPENPVLSAIFDGIGEMSFDGSGNWKVALTNDVDGTIELPDNIGNLTIDLNGHSMKGSDGQPAVLIASSDADGAATELSICNSGAGVDSAVVGGDGGGSGVEIAEGALAGVLVNIGARVSVTGGTGSSSQDDAGGTGGAGVRGTVGVNAGTISGGAGGDSVNGAGGEGGVGVSGDVGINNGYIAGGAGGSSTSGEAGRHGIAVDGVVGGGTGTIEKIGVAIPAISAKTYDGTKLVADVPNSTYWVVEANEGGVTAGTYKVTLVLVDPQDSGWNDGQEGAARTLEWQILPRSLSSEMVEAIDAQVYTGSEIAPEPTVTDAELEVTLVKDSDYEIEYSDNVYVGNATATVSGIGNYTGAVVLQFAITKATYDMSTAQWDYPGGFAYDGSAKSVVLTGLPEGVTATYSGNSATDIGTYTAHATLAYDSANYNEPTIADLTWKIMLKDELVLVKAFEGVGDVASDGEGGWVVTLAQDVSGTIELPDNIGNVTINLNGHMIAGTDGSDGADGQPAIRIVASGEDGAGTAVTLVDSQQSGAAGVVGGNGGDGATPGSGGAGIEVAADAKEGVVVNIGAGVVVSGGEGGEGEGGSKGVDGKAVVGEIGDNQGEVVKVAISVPAIPAKEYSGAVQTADVPESADYEVTANEGGTDVGAYEVTLALTDVQNTDWADGADVARTVSWQILPRTISIDMVGTIAAQEYTGAAITPKPVVSNPDLGVNLVNGTDYELAYANNIEPGTARVTITGKGKYRGSVVQAFTIKSPYKLTIKPNSTKYGAVSGSGTYAAGKKVTVKAKAKSGYAFAGWFTDKKCTKALNPKGYDNRQPSVKIVMPAKKATYYAKFITKAAAKKSLKFTSSAKKLAKTPAKANAGKAFSLKFGVASGTLPTITATGLPKGLSIDKATGLISGTPTKPGAYTAVVTVKDAAKNTISQKVKITVVTAAYARGTFYGTARPGKSGDPVAHLTFTIGSTGKVSGKVSYKGKAYSFKTALSSCTASKAAFSPKVSIGSSTFKPGTVTVKSVKICDLTLVEAWNKADTFTAQKKANLVKTGKTLAALVGKSFTFTKKTKNSGLTKSKDSLKVLLENGDKVSASGTVKGKSLSPLSAPLLVSDVTSLPGATTYKLYADILDATLKYYKTIVFTVTLPTTLDPVPTVTAEFEE